MVLIFLQTRFKIIFAKQIQQAAGRGMEPGEAVLPAAGRMGS
jgi:hypothetical protein